ncbi:hypothetical protein MTO96_005400 [Rhipicephalus appendiculatus]
MRRKDPKSECAASEHRGLSVGVARKGCHFAAEQQRGATMERRKVSGEAKQKDTWRKQGEKQSRVQRSRVLRRAETMVVGAKSAEKKRTGKCGKRREKIGNSGQELLRPQKTFHQRCLESGSFTHAKWPLRRFFRSFVFFPLAIPNPAVECDVITEREQGAFAAACSSCRAADLGSRPPIVLFSFGHAGPLKAIR